MANPKIPDLETLWPEIHKWRLHERKRPLPHKIPKPKPGQESVWDYPRPPQIEAIDKEGKVFAFNNLIASSRNLLRVIECSTPPTYYFPLKDVNQSFLEPTQDWTLCEWKGIALYWDIVIGSEKIQKAAWTYPDPLTDINKQFYLLKDYIAFYPNELDCFLDGEKISPLSGNYYGGWVTKNVLGPFKTQPES